jgi:flagellar biosynthesis/type III secretory pathway protein FliH
MNQNKIPDTEIAYRRGYRQGYDQGSEDGKYKSWKKLCKYFDTKLMPWSYFKDDKKSWEPPRL